MKRRWFLLPVVYLSLAMSWAGMAGAQIDVRVLVTDDNGAGLPQTLVVLQSESGPATSALTEEDGRASFDGLAAGEWQVDVRREGYMLYTGYIKISVGQPPEVGFSSKQRTGTFWAPLEVSFAAGEGGVMVADRGDQKRARREQARRRRQEERLARRAAKGDMARVVESEAAEPRAGRDRARLVEPEAPPPAPPRAQRVAPAEACLECAASEWTASSLVQVPARSPGQPCPGDLEAILGEALALLEEVDSESFASFAGPVQDADHPDLLEVIAGVPGGQALAQHIGPYLASAQSCPMLMVALPRGARFIGYRTRAGDSTGDGDCLGTDECPIGGASFIDLPWVETITDGGLLIATAFRNNSTTEPREAELRIYFTPPAGWQPP